jgi:glutathione S-transferase
VLAPFFGLTPNPESAKEAEKLLVRSLKTIESEWLKGDAKFLHGNPQPSIADLSLMCEITQLEVHHICLHIMNECDFCHLSDFLTI